MSKQIAFTQQQVSEALGMTKTAVAQQVAAGRIPAFKVGGRSLVPAAWFIAAGFEVPAARSAKTSISRSTS